MVKKVAPAPAAGDVLKVTEFALVENLPGGGTQGRFSHESKGVVEHKRDALLVQAADHGLPSPDLSIVRRDCTYPVGADGAVHHAKSEVTETVL